jgi:hypothetical protein
VRLLLEAEGRTWPIAKIGPDTIVPAAAFNIPACDAEIVLTVDGKERRWKVELIDGVCPFDTEVRIRNR